MRSAGRRDNKSRATLTGHEAWQAFLCQDSPSLRDKASAGEEEEEDSETLSSEPRERTWHDDDDASNQTRERPEAEASGRTGRDRP